MTAFFTRPEPMAVWLGPEDKIHNLVRLDRDSLLHIFELGDYGTRLRGRLTMYLLSAEASPEGSCY